MFTVNINRRHDISTTELLCNRTLFPCNIGTPSTKIGRFPSDDKKNSPVLVNLQNKVEYLLDLKFLHSDLKFNR